MDEFLTDDMLEEDMSEHAIFVMGKPNNCKFCEAHLNQYVIEHNCGHCCDKYSFPQVDFMLIREKVYRMTIDHSSKHVQIHVLINGEFHQLTWQDFF
jgi:hypothetical protein